MPVDDAGRGGETARAGNHGWNVISRASSTLNLSGEAEVPLYCLLFLLVFFIGFGPTRAHAGAPGIDAFTRHGAGVRAVGMGKAATSIPMGAGSFYWNPAGLGLIEGTEITSLFSQPYTEVDDLQYHTVGFAHRC